MTSVLEKLFDGELDPSGRDIRNSPQYKKELKQLIAAENMLCATFGEEQKALFEEYVYRGYRASDAEMKDKFKYGFRLGMMMTMEAFSMGDDYMAST